MHYLNTASGAGCYCAVDFCRQSLRDNGDRQPAAVEKATTFEYHWTVADYVQAAIDGGCRIVEVVEYGEQIGDEQWLEKMPAHLLIVGRKKGSA